MDQLGPARSVCAAWLIPYEHNHPRHGLSCSISSPYGQTVGLPAYANIAPPPGPPPFEVAQDRRKVTRVDQALFLLVTMVGPILHTLSDISSDICQKHEFFLNQELRPT